MGNKELLNYDAFISYRHAELDSFVAETVHRELEKFKLPNNLIKERGADKKSKIERVFRDREELPIASDLSMNIQQALNHSEFLIVICTPRLRESVWCKNEIDTFMQIKGRNRILAVLAEGEPSESFPEQLTQGVEPLAADVRGSSKAEIKKKIKQEVMRLAAAMFECNYDEIRQRHREQLMKKRATIASIIAAAGIIFAGTVSILALQISAQNEKISEQYDQIEEQYAQIEAQYQDTLVKQSKIIVSQAENFLNEGNVADARNLITETMTEAGDKLPEEAASNYKYILGETLGCYSNGSTLKPIQNLSMDYAIKLVSVSNDFNYVAAFDQGNNLAIFSLENFEKIYEASTDFDCSDEGKQNYGYDLEGNFYYLGENTLAKIDLNKGKLDYTTTIANGRRLASIDDERFFVMGGNTAYVVSKSDGSILYSKTLDSFSDYSYIEKLILSTDKRRMLVAGIADEEDIIVSVDVEDLSIVNSIKIGDASIIAGIGVGNNNIVLESMVMGESAVWNNEYTLMGVDDRTLEIKWEKKADCFYTQMFMLNDSILGVYSGGINMLNPSDGSIVNSCQIDRNISDLALTPDGRLRLFLTDASHKIQNEGELSFFEDTSYIVGLTDVKAYKYAGYNYIFLPFNSNKLCVYSKQAAKDATEVTLTEEDSDKTVLCDLSKEKEYSDSKLGIKVVLNPDNSADVISTNDNEVRLSVELDDFSKVRRVSDKYIAVGDYHKYYIINLETFLIEAKVYGYIDYDENSNMFTISNGVYSTEGYTVNFKNIDELMKMAK